MSLGAKSSPPASWNDTDSWQHTVTHTSRRRNRFTNTSGFTNRAPLFHTGLVTNTRQRQRLAQPHTVTHRWRKHCVFDQRFHTFPSQQQNSGVPLWINIMFHTEWHHFVINYSFIFFIVEGEMGVASWVGRPQTPSRGARFRLRRPRSLGDSRGPRHLHIPLTSSPFLATALRLQQLNGHNPIHCTHDTDLALGIFSSLSTVSYTSRNESLASFTL